MTILVIFIAFFYFHLVLSSSSSSSTSELESSTSVVTSHESLFGNVAAIDDQLGAVSIIIIVASVLLFEHLFMGLHELTDETPFAVMVDAIENELMIVGCMSFIYKIMVDAAPHAIPHNWLYALEFADILIPITSFCFCIEGVFLVLLTMRQVNLWTKAYHLKLVEIFEEFLSMKHYDFFLRYSWLPISELNSQMEFRIFHGIFCDQYSIRSYGGFAFDEYVHKVLEKYLLHMIEIRPVDWALVLALVFGNWGRNVLGYSSTHCTQTSSTVQAEEYCEENNSILIFTIFGGAMCGLCLVLAVVSRIYELRVMAVKGVYSSREYLLYLMTCEGFGSASTSSTAVSRRGYDEAGLKEAISNLKSAKALQEHTEGKTFPGGWHLFFKCFRLCKSVDETVVPGSDHNSTSSCHEESFTEDVNSSMKDGMKDYYFRAVSGGMNGSMKGGMKKKKDGLVHALNKSRDRLGNDRSSSSLDDNDHPDPAPRPTAYCNSNTSPAPSPTRPGRMLHKRNSLDHNRETMKRSTHVISTSMSSRPSDKSSVEVVATSYQHQSHRNFQLGWSEDLSKIFIMGWPALYFETVRITVMLLSFYLALWMVNFLGVSINKLHSPVWALLSLGLGVLAFLLYAYVVKCASLLKGIVYIDHECIEETLEQTEGSRALGEIMKHKLVSRLKDPSMSPEAEMMMIFDEIDGNGSSLLSRGEFRLFIEAMGVSFSKKRWMQIFREIDKNFDDEISFHELLLFLFPNNEIAMKKEEERIKEVTSRVLELLHSRGLQHLIPDRDRDRSRHISDLDLKQVSSASASLANTERSVTNLNALVIEPFSADDHHHHHHYSTGK